MKNLKFRFQYVGLILLVSTISSVSTVVLINLFNPPLATAQVQTPTTELTLYAGPRRDTFKDESYIFYDPAKGEIWVYRNEKFKKHLKVVAMGQPLEKLK